MSDSGAGTGMVNVPIEPAVEPVMLRALVLSLSALRTNEGLGQRAVHLLRELAARGYVIEPSAGSVKPDEPGEQIRVERAEQPVPGEPVHVERRDIV